MTNQNIYLIIRENSIIKFSDKENVNLENYFVELKFFVSKTQIKRVLNKSRNEVPYNEFIYFVFKILKLNSAVEHRTFYKNICYSSQNLRK